MQGATADLQNWSTFLSSLQASQEKVVSEPAASDWAGTVYWNGIWDSAMNSEAQKRQESQKGAVDHAAALSEAAAAPTTGIYTHWC